MQRNTFLFVAGLAILAALIVGVNIGRRSLPLEKETTPTPTVSPSPRLTRYESTACGVSFSYPDTFIRLDSATKSAILTSPEGGAEAIILTCQEEIPRPAIPQEQTEPIAIGSVSGTLYHDTTSKDGKPIDILIFTHPQTREDVLLSGMGQAFQGAIQSLTLLP